VGGGRKTADIEFAWTREAAGDRGTHLLLYHISVNAHGIEADTNTIV